MLDIQLTMEDGGVDTNVIESRKLEASIGPNGRHSSSFNFFSL